MDQLTKAIRGFIFRGNAVAAGGYLTKVKGAPVATDTTRVTVHGESSLPVIGGVSHSLVSSPVLAFPTVIAYGTCSTVAEGTGDANSKTTTLFAAVTNVRITNSPSKSDNVSNLQSVSFVASRLAVSARSTHPSDGSTRFQLLDAPDTTGMSLIQTPIKGTPITIPLHLTYDPAFLTSCTMDDLDAQFTKDRRFYDDHCPFSDLSMVFGKSKLPRNTHGYVVTSVVTSIRRGDKEIKGNVLVEPGLGVITFGTVIMDGDNRRVTLVKIDLGSEEEGSVAFAGTDSNGIWN